MIALMVTCVHVALALWLKFKKRENHCWYLQAIIFWLASGKIQDCVMEEEEFKDLKN
jgi:hypothetical protein